MRQTDYVILGLLSEEPMSGYQIKRIIEIRFQFFWSESYGQLYPALKALSDDELIEELETENQSKRAQKVYQITQQGRAALGAWLEQPVEKESVRLEILLRMYFSGNTTPEVMLGHIQRFQEAHQRDLAILHRMDEELRNIEDADPAHPVYRRVVDFGLKTNTAYLDWCAETIEFLKERV